MEEIDLIKNLERISSEIPNRVLKIEGYIIKEKKKEELEIIIFKGFSSSTTHSIEINLEKKVIEFDHFFKTFKLFKAPLTNTLDICIKENQNSIFFLNKKNWI